MSAPAPPRKRKPSAPVVTAPAAVEHQQHAEQPQHQDQQQQQQQHQQQQAAATGATTRRVREALAKIQRSTVLLRDSPIPITIDVVVNIPQLSVVYDPIRQGIAEGMSDIVSALIPGSRVESSRQVAPVSLLGPNMPPFSRVCYTVIVSGAGDGGDAYARNASASAASAARTG